MFAKAAISRIKKIDEIFLFHLIEYLPVDIHLPLELSFC